MVYIYILQLEKGKFYVGKTINPSFRLDSHFNSNGSAWTKIYKPIKMIELIPNCDDYDEDKYTRMYMDKYGIDNVRGGSFVSVELEQSTINHLKQMKMEQMINVLIVENQDILRKIVKKMKKKLYGVANIVIKNSLMKKNVIIIYKFVNTTMKMMKVKMMKTTIMM